MRVVRDLSQFAGELSEAKREALSGFGDDRVLLERYVEHPRHIEFQIFGGADGEVIHLFERECSIQRRHQKIIEESPSPVMNPELRTRMAEAAAAAGRAAGYQNAGTVEFLLEEHPDREPTFYFLEVNARLQVEHPVTEMIAGVDLVKAQLRTAVGLPHGMKLPAQPIGHAVEVRIYAEDPATGFLPSIGRLHEWIEPHAPWIRVDSGVERGCDVSPYFDPMLAKVIAWGEDRREAINRMIAALKSMAVLGIETNISYLLDILAHPDFQEGQFSIRFLDEQFKQWKPKSELPADVLLALAAYHALPSTGRSTVTTTHQQSFDPWKSSSGWRNVAGAAQ
jgi:acetyl/propionyl-CoA carboxylase alpha subunit